MYINTGQRLVLWFDYNIIEKKQYHLQYYKSYYCNIIHTLLSINTTYYTIYAPILVYMFQFILQYYFCTILFLYNIIFNIHKFSSLHDLWSHFAVNLFGEFC